MLRICILLVVVIISALAQMQHDRYYHRVVCVGDFHGDMDQALSLLRSANVISVQPDYYKQHLLEEAEAEVFPMKEKDKEGMSAIDRNNLNKGMVENKRAALMMGSTAGSHHWCGGKLLLISTGDAMDVGPDDLEILRFFMRLEREAAAVGGKVVYLLGNHEMLNLQGNFYGVHPWSFEKSGGKSGRIHLLSMRTSVGQWLRSRNVMHYNDGLLFVHGGLFPATVEAFTDAFGLSKVTNAQEFVSTINYHVRAVLEGTTPYDKAARIVTNIDYENNGNINPLLIHPLKECDKVLRANQMMPGVTAQVVGHTPHPLPNFVFCGAKLFAIDFQMSKWKSGRQAEFAGMLFVTRDTSLPTGNGTSNRWHAELIYPMEVARSASPALDVNTMLLSPLFWCAIVIAILSVEVLRWIYRIWRSQTSSAEAKYQPV